jgi:ribosome-associated protein YbcJ (S4-like RNA binding protein)
LGKIVPDTVAATIHHQKEQVVKLMQFLKKEGAVHG